ncbi:type I-E CRISPR-associated endoribonuclease Cas2 [Amycolatopsis sp. NPDC004169]|uniref:type I-E CRISPR-associated endoribonuclease Cas2 n=1 Tax=Amycolatopsis sp. NPDC004169 TaxID=3154453 RepID=UPI0033B1A07B
MDDDVVVPAHAGLVPTRRTPAPRTRNRVFVGRVTTRVRVLMWERVLDMVKTGRAIMVYHADNEQGLAFEVHRHGWTPIDFEGIQLMLRPDPRRTTDQTRKNGWSNASRRRRYQRGSTQSE